MFYLLCPVAGQRSTLFLPLVLDMWEPAVPACCSPVPGATSRGSSPLAATCRGGKAASGVPAPDAAPSCPQTLTSACWWPNTDVPRPTFRGRRSKRRRTEDVPSCHPGGSGSRQDSHGPSTHPSGRSDVDEGGTSNHVTGTRRDALCSPTSPHPQPRLHGQSQTWCPVSGLPTPGDGA